MTYTGKRSPFFVKLRFAADNDGKLLGMESDWSVDHGPYSEFGDLLTQKGAQFMGAGYDIPNIRGEGRCVATNHAWGAPFPGLRLTAERVSPPKCSWTCWPKKIGLDPFDIRYRNLLREGATMPHGQKPEVYSYPKMMDLLKPKYEAAVDKAKAESTAEVKRGVGISLGMYGCGNDGPDPSAVEVELGPDETVTVYNTWSDHGQGADMGSLGTAHEALRPLGVPVEKIKLVMNDMVTTPDSGPSGGSRQQVITGRATQAACQALLQGLSEGRRHVPHVRRNGGRRPAAQVHRPVDHPLHPSSTKTVRANPSPVYMYGVFMSEVAVDVKTGQTTVEKMTCVADIGTINNKLVTDGQIYGGLAQGIGLALTEDFEDIQKHSTLMGAGFPYAKMVPDDMEIMYVESPRGEGPFGAAGVGELPLTSPHAAVINAIYNACGVRITQLPARPEKVLAGLSA